MASMGELQGENHCWQKRTQRLVSHLPRNILMIPKTFGEIFYGLTRQKINFLEGVQPVTSGVKITQHLIKRTLCQQSNMVVAVWWSGAALLLQDLDNLLWLIEQWILLSTRKSWRQRPSVRALKLKCSWVMQQGNEYFFTALYMQKCRMGKKCDLSDFQRGMIVVARQGGLCISETAELLGFSRTTL